MRRWSQRGSRNRHRKSGDAFLLFFVWGPKGFDLRREGTGNKVLTDAAFKDLRALSEEQVARLFAEAARVGGKT